MASKRVVLRVHEQWLDDYNKIADDWFMTHGYPKADGDELFKGIARHDTRLGYIGGGRFHIIIDLEEDLRPKPTDLSEIPIAIYRVRRGSNGQRMIFQYIGEKEQPNVYSTVRGFGQDFPWGC